MYILHLDSTELPEEYFSDPSPVSKFQPIDISLLQTAIPRLKIFFERKGKKYRAQRIEKLSPITKTTKRRRRQVNDIR